MDFIDSDSSLPPGTRVLDNHSDVTADAATARNATHIALQFPKWTDGRAYSQAVLLRARVRYTGQLIACGDVLADMLPLLQRCGFDAVQMRADQSLQTAQRALGVFGATPAAAALRYQASASERVPVRLDPGLPPGHGARL